LKPARFLFYTTSKYTLISYHESDKHSPICLFLLVPHNRAVLFCACLKPKNKQMRIRAARFSGGFFDTLKIAAGIKLKRKDLK